MLSAAAASAQVDARMFRYPAVSATQIAFVYAGDRPPPQLTGRRGDLSALLARRHPAGLQRRLRRQPRGLCRAVRGRRAGPAHASPDGRSRRRLASRWQARAVRLGPRERPPALQPVLSGGPRRRPARKAARAVRRVRRLLARRQAVRLHADVAGLPQLEALSRRLGARLVALRSDHLRGAQHYKQSRQRRAADVARQHDLFPVGSRRERAQQSLGRGSADGPRSPDHAVHRFRHHVSVDRARCDCLPGRWPVISARSRIGEKRGGERPRHHRRIDAAAAHGKSGEADCGGVGIADGQARGVRGARRRGDASCRARRRAEPHADVGCRRAVSALVA